MFFNNVWCVNSYVILTMFPTRRLIRRLDSGDCYITASGDETKVHSSCLPAIKRSDTYPLCDKGVQSAWCTPMPDPSAKNTFSFDDSLQLSKDTVQGIATSTTAKDIRRPPHAICSTPQSFENTDKFVARVRALFDFPSTHKNDISEQTQLDVVYGLLHNRIRKRLLREEFSTFNQLLHLAHKIENSLTEMPSCSWYERAVAAYCERYGISKGQSG